MTAKMPAAPLHRSVCQLTGEVKPSKFFEANVAADDRLAELDALRTENAALKSALEDLQASEIGDVQAHNNELFHQNGVLRRRVQVLERQLAVARSERDTANAVAGGRS